MKRGTLISIILVGIVGLLVIISVNSSFNYTRRTTSHTEFEIRGEKFRLDSWREEYLFSSKEGWSKSNFRNGEWVILDQGDGPCPFNAFTLMSEMAKDK